MELARWLVGLDLDGRRDGGLLGCGGFGIVALSRGSSRGGRQSPPREGKVTPEDVLAERFARGEIDVDEYERRFKVLGGRRRP